VKYNTFYIEPRCMCKNVAFTSVSTCDLLQPSAFQWKELHILLVSTVQAKSLIIRKGRIITGMFLIWHEKRQNTLTLKLLFPGDIYWSTVFHVSSIPGLFTQSYCSLDGILALPSLTLEYSSLKTKRFQNSKFSPLIFKNNIE